MIDRHNNPYLTDKFWGRTGQLANMISEIPSLFDSKIDKNIRHFFDNAGLFENTDYGSWLGTPARRYPKYSYELHEDNIILVFYSDGFFKLDDLKKEIEEYFCREVVNFYFDSGRWIYIVSTNVSNRLLIDKKYLIDSFYNFWNSHDFNISSNLTWNIDKSPHALVVGNTGSGKTYFFETLILQILTRKSRIYLVDPKHSDLFKIGKIIDPFCVASDFDNTLTILNAIQYEMESRYIAMDRGIINQDYRNSHLAPVFLIFDEYAAFKANLTRKQGKEIDDLLFELILKGRQAGIFVLIGIQKPDASILSTAIRDNLGLKLALGNMSFQAYVQIFGTSDSLNGRKIGEGYIYLTGMGWNNPRFVKTPTFKNDFDINEFLVQIRHARLCRESSHTND